MSWNPKYALLIAFSTAVTYASGLLIGHFRGEERVRTRKWCVALSLIINLGILAVFKYMIFIVKTLHEFSPATKESLAIPDIALPIGISFFIIRSALTNSVTPSSTRLFIRAVSTSICAVKCFRRISTTVSNNW